MYSVFTFTHSVHSKLLVVNIITTFSGPGLKTNFGKKTFHYRAAAAILWNKLPSNIRVNFNSLSVNQFKNAVAS